MSLHGGMGIVMPSMTREEVLRRRRERAEAAERAHVEMQRIDWTSLPDCVLLYILQALPLSSLPVVAQVCRRWRVLALSLLADPGACSSQPSSSSGKVVRIFDLPHSLSEQAGVAYENGSGENSFRLRLLMDDGTRVELCRLGKGMLPTAAPLLRCAELLEQCVVMMNAGGYFAIARFEGKRCVKHTSFHRYICRKKCGGRQSTRDKTGSGQRRSIGAQIRRDQEEHFRSKVRETVIEWSAQRLFDHCSIWMAAPGPINRADLFFTDSPLIAHPGIASIPFPTSRPCYTEICRAWTDLTQVRILQ